MAVPIITSRGLRTAGESTRGLERGARSDLFVRLRPGAYAVAAEWNAATPRERHRAVMDALVATATREPVFSHESAALLHAVPVIGDWPAWPHLLDSELGPASRRSPRGAIVHRPRHLPPVTRVAGIAATTPLATAIALASSRPLRAGVVALDHVLFAGIPRSDVEAMITEWGPFHGARRARRALAQATGRAETPLETISLIGMREHGIPEPEQQVELDARGCRYRVDFFWRDRGVIGEADGRIKYLTGDDLLAEKDREDDLRSLGLGFARWGWDDAWACTPMLARLADAGIHAAPPVARYSA